MFSPMSNLDINRNWTLEELSDLKSHTLVLSVVYLVFLMVIGVLGNSLVIVVYYFRYHASTHRYFILVLALNDFVACAVGVPYTIADSFFVYTYYDVISCKCFRFILYYTGTASGLTLVLIAFERFQKICRPLKPQMSVKIAKLALFVVAGISLLSVFPSFVIFGNATIATGIGNLTGTRCFVADRYIGTGWSQGFNVYLVILTVASVSCIFVCYVSIGLRVAQVNRESIKRGCASDKYKGQFGNSKSNKDDSDIDSDAPSPKLSTDTMISSRSDGAKMSISSSSGNTLIDLTDKSKKRVGNILRRFSRKPRRKTLRVTKMLTTVTVAFVLSYTPHLILQLWDMFTTPDQKDLFPKDNLYTIIYYSFLLNNIINPGIYACMDLKFRKELKNTLRCLSRAN